VRILGVGALALCLLVSGCTATARPTSHPTASQDALQSYDATDISTLTETDRFGGYSFSRSHRTATIYRTAATTSDDMSQAEGIGLPAGYTLRFTTVRRSWTGLEHLEQTLPKTLPSSLRPLLSEVDVDASANGLRVGFTRVDGSTAAKTRSVLGDALAGVLRADRATAD
jgi:hypothetical protein